MSLHLDGNTSAFLEKIKKQAKRLLKFSKTNNLKIEIKNLADAQNLIAQVNGYNDWHALQKKLSNNETQDFSVNNLVKSIDSISLTKIKDLFVLEQSNSLVSFFELLDFKLHFSSAASWVSELKNQLSFKWNMEFHQIKILFEMSNENSSITSSQNFSQWSDILGISPEEYNDLFKIDLNFQNNNYGMKVVIAIKTITGLINEHIDFCETFISHGDFINKDTIQSSELELLNLDNNSEKMNNLNLMKNLSKLIEPPQYIKFDTENLNWLAGLYNIYQKKINSKIVVGISTKNVIWENFIIDEKNENYNIFLNGLWNSLNKQVYDSFNFAETINLKLTPNIQSSDSLNCGIPVINKTNSNISFLGNDKYKTTENIIIYAKPGSGKSMISNLFNLNNILEKSNEYGEIPYSYTIDIGPSSKGLVHFLKDNSNINDFNYYQLKENDSINPFDLPLGLRYPGATQLSFLNNYIQLLISDDNITGMSSFIHSLIEKAYLHFDKEQPKNYVPGLIGSIDKKLQELNYIINKDTTWWDIVDILFKNKEIELAIMAQTLAVPTILDLCILSLSSELNNLYKNIQVNTGETIVQYFNREISDLINLHRFIHRPTNLFTNNKIVSLDLDLVAKSGGVIAQKQTAIYYMLIMFLSAKNTKFFVNDYIGLDIQPEYKNYLIEEQKNQRKMATLFFDEIHRITQFNSVRNQIGLLLRESRKFNFRIILSSQSISDLKNFNQYCSTILCAMTQSNRKETIELIEILQSNNNKIQNQILDNKYKFGDWFCKRITNKGVYEEIISLQINPIILWIFSTTVEDVVLRTKIIEKYGYIKGIKKLAESFPSGSKRFFEEEKIKYGNYSILEIIDNFIKNNIV